MSAALRPWPFEPGTTAVAATLPAWRQISGQQGQAPARLPADVWSAASALSPCSRSRHWSATQLPALPVCRSLRSSASTQALTVLLRPELCAWHSCDSNSRPPFSSFLCRSLGSGTTPQPLLQLGRQSHWVWQARFSPAHDTLILSASSDSTVVLWHTPSLVSCAAWQAPPC